MFDSVSLPHLERGRVRPTLPIPCSFSGLPTVPSAPIQIPASRRRAMGDRSVDIVQNTSPLDSIFEMSPITTECAGRHHPSFSIRRSPDKFLYTVPAFAGRPSQSISDQLHPTPSDSTSTLSCLNKRYRATDPFALKRNPAPPKASCALDEYDLSPVQLAADGAPEMDESDYSPQPEHKNLRRLSPGPRQASYSSPWILPGRGDGSPDSEDVACSQVDPSTFEYQRHLLKRIESQNPSRILNMRSYM